MLSPISRLQLPLGPDGPDPNPLCLSNAIFNPSTQSDLPLHSRPGPWCTFYIPTKFPLFYWLHSTSNISKLHGWPAHILSLLPQSSLSISDTELMNDHIPSYCCKTTNSMNYQARIHYKNLWKNWPIRTILMNWDKEFKRTIINFIKEFKKFKEGTEITQ